MADPAPTTTPGTATTTAPSSGRRLYWRTTVDERVGDRSIDDRSLEQPPQAAVVGAKPRVQRAFRVDEAIATLEHAWQLAAAPVPRFILAREWVGHVLRWMRAIVTDENVRARFTTETVRDPLMSRPVADPLLRMAVGETAYLLRRLQDPLVRELSRATWDKAIQSVRAARVPLLVLNDEFVSFELAQATTLPTANTNLPNLTPAENHVLAWLQKYRGDLEDAEARYVIDRRGIAGAIAWEALIDARASSPRSIGPGKVHLWEFFKTPLAEEVEQAGLVPTRSPDERRKILATRSGSITYIAAIMKAFADIARDHGYSIDCDPSMLANCYNAWNLANWRTHVARKEEARDPKSPRAALTLGNPMGFWVQANLNYLEEGVGVSDRCRTLAATLTQPGQVPVSSQTSSTAASRRPAPDAKR